MMFRFLVDIKRVSPNRAKWIEPEALTSDQVTKRQPNGQKETVKTDNKPSEKCFLAFT